MKKFIIATITLGLGLTTVGSVNAFVEEAADFPSQITNQKDVQEKFVQAVKERQFRYYKQKMTTAEYIQLYSQKARHVEGQKEINVNDQSTTMNREGDLQDLSGVKEMSRTRYERPNAKQTFRARAVDYYVDGGDAGTEAVKSNVIYGSEHKVSTVPVISEEKKAEIGAIIAPIRETIRLMDKPELVGTGYQKITFRRGDFFRNFASPYQEWK